MKLTESNSVNLDSGKPESAVAAHEYEATGLLPCPFCDDAAIYGKTDDGGRFVTCVNLGCLASTNVRYACGDDPLPILAEQWNRRAGMQPPNNQPNSDHVAVTSAEPESRLEWIDAFGCKERVTKEYAIELLKEYLDAWPGRLDEIESSINGWINRALAAESGISSPDRRPNEKDVVGEGK